MTARTLVMVGAAVLLLGGGAAAGPLDWFTGNRAEPPTLSDMQAVTRALAPYARDRSTAVGITVYGGGKVHISVDLKDGSHVYGIGDSLPDAMQELCRNSIVLRDSADKIVKVLTPLLPSQ